jgi:DNA repair exonuclease SbcCD ATPase subunit
MRRLPDDHKRPEWRLAAEALELSVSWWSQAVASESVGRFDTMERLLALAHALDNARGILSEVLPEAKKQAEPMGQTLAELLEEGERGLIEVAEEINALHHELEPLEAQEGRLRALVGQRDSLERRIAELRHLETLADGVGELREQAEEIEANLPNGAHEAGLMEDRIERQARRLVTLSEERLGQIADEVREQLGRAEEGHHELRAAAAELAEARERLGGITSQLTERMEVIELYREADARIADALGGGSARDVGDILDRVESMLEQADRALALAIEANKQANALQPIGVTGGAIQ